MSKKKFQAQADDYLRRILELLEAFEGVSNIDQYKDAFFDVFEEAFRSGFCNPGFRFDEESGRYVRCKSQRPLVLGDTIRSHARARGWVHSEMSGNEQRYKDIELVTNWWDEWIYVCSRSPLKRKYERHPSSES